MRNEGADANGLGRAGESDSGELGDYQGDGERYDTRPIVLSESASAPETQTPPYPEQQEDADVDAEPVRNYRCSECGYILVYGEESCVGCGDRKNWRGVKA